VGAGQFDADLSAAIFARVLVDQRFDIDLRGAEWRNADGYRERHVAGGGGQRPRGMRASKARAGRRAGRCIMPATPPVLRFRPFAEVAKDMKADYRLVWMRREMRPVVDPASS
jgi:hypothetical protein